MQKATWSKSKDITSTPLLLTFKEKEPPRSIEIPGEQARNQVHEHYEQLISCKKYPNYGHTVIRYREQQRRLRGAATKDTTKISTPVPK